MMVSCFTEVAAGARAGEMAFVNCKPYFDRPSPILKPWPPRTHFLKPTTYLKTTGDVARLHRMKPLSSLSERPVSFFYGGGGFSSEARTVTVVDEGKVPTDTPCLMVPAGLLLAEGEEEASLFKLTTTTMEEKEEPKDGHNNTTTNDYYDLLSVEGNKLVLKKKIKKEKNFCLPWQRDFLSPDEAICFGSSHGWLAFIHPFNCSIYLYNPLIINYATSLGPYIPLPPIETLPSVISSLRRHRFSRKKSSYSIVTEYMVPECISPLSSQRLSKDFFQKIAFSSSPPYSNNVDEDDCTVMAIQSYQLAFCRIGDASWTALDQRFTPHTNIATRCQYLDIVYCSNQQLFYALTGCHTLEAWDLRNPTSPKNTLVTEPVCPTMSLVNEVVQCCCNRSYLVESSGDLLMVHRYHSRAIPSKTVAFDVYKFDLVGKKWIKVPSLGDRVLFVGVSHCESLSAHDFPGLIPNSIYFTPQHIKQDSSECNDLGVFNLEDNSIYRRHLNKKVRPSPTWILPHL